MRREGNKGWKLAREVFRNNLIRRYDGMKEDLGKMSDPEIFKAITQLEGRRAIPALTNECGAKIVEHDIISDMIAAQLNPSEY